MLTIIQCAHVKCRHTINQNISDQWTGHTYNKKMYANLEPMAIYFCTIIKLAIFEWMNLNVFTYIKSGVVEKKIQHIESIVKRSIFIYQYYVEIEHKTQQKHFSCHPSSSCMALNFICHLCTTVHWRYSQV